MLAPAAETLQNKAGSRRLSSSGSEAKWQRTPAPER